MVRWRKLRLPRLDDRWSIVINCSVDMECPQCGMINPPGTDRCDCGYAFTADGIMGRPVRPAQTAPKTNWVALAATAIISVILILWLFGPNTGPKPKFRDQSESLTADLDRIFMLRGQVISAVRGSACLPSPSSWDRVLGAGVDDEEASRAVIREARLAGWPRTVLIRNGDKIKILGADSTMPAGTLAHIRPAAHQWLDEGCWVPASTVLEKTAPR